MKENFYLRPLFTLVNNIKDNSKPLYIEVLKPIKNHNFVVEDLIDVKEYLLKNNYSKSLAKYKNLNNRINKILKEKNLNKFNKKKPLIMGILNLTTDSFYDGGKYINQKNALLHADKMLNEGADIIDVGAESSRPGASPINVNLEIERITPIIKELTKNKVKISCDTRNSLTMEKALDAGASIINDISGLNYDKNTFSLIKKYNCTYIFTHSKGTPLNMQNNPIYKNVICDIHSFFKKGLKKLENMNISTKNIILDPGIGFGKKDLHNFSILKNFSVFQDLGLPMLIGVSRKSFIQKFINSDKEQTLTSSVTLALNAYLKGCNILRVHDVKETLDAINIYNKVS